MPVEMTTRTAVPLVRTGSYLLSTGPATFTEEDLRAAVAAYENDPAVHAPRVKIDGLAENFNPEAHGGEPALGSVTNLRVDASGQTLIGDVVIPKWLDDIADWAYPNRSVEAVQGVTMPTGQSHDMILTAVALLGVDLPGVSTLPDLAELIANGPLAGETVDEPQQIAASHGWQGKPIRAGMDQDIVKRRFYEALEGGDIEIPEEVGHQGDVWIASMRFDKASKPYLKVIDESSGRLYRVDFTVSGNEVSFTDGPEWVEVAEEDVPVAAGAPRPRTVVAWATRAESRPTPSQETDMNVAEIREAAGLTAEQLPDDATAEQVAAALRTTPEPVSKEGDPAPEPEPTPEPAPVAASAKPPEGMAFVDTDTLNELKAAAQKANDLAAKADKDRRDAVISAAIKDRKITRASREGWERKWAADHEEAERLLTASVDDGGLVAGIVPGDPVGVEPEGEGVAASQGTGWFNTEAEGR